MDGKTEILKDELDQLLSAAAVVAVELQTAERGIGKPLHFMQIEAAAHGLGTQLSCRIQALTSREMAAESPLEESCPACGSACKLVIERRIINSADGPMDIWEPCGHCTRCRRDFFPSA